RRIARVAAAAKASLEHFAERAVVVAAARRLHPVRAVALLVGLAVFERDHGSDRVFAAEVRDVDALDAPRQRGQTQTILDAREPLVDVGFGAALLFERVARVFVREVEELPSGAALRGDDVHGARTTLTFGGELDAALAQPLGDAFGALGQARHDD